MKKIIVFWIFTLISCSSKSSQEILSEKDMTQLLYELTLTNSIQSNYINADSIRITKDAKEILQTFKLDSLNFIKVHQYYINQPQVYARIFDTIKNRLQRQIISLEEQQNKEELLKKDSLDILDLKK